MPQRKDGEGGFRGLFGILGIMWIWVLSFLLFYGINYILFILCFKNVCVYSICSKIIIFQNKKKRRK